MEEPGATAGRRISPNPDRGQSRARAGTHQADIEGRLRRHGGESLQVRVQDDEGVGSLKAVEQIGVTANLTPADG